MKTKFVQISRIVSATALIIGLLLLVKAFVPEKTQKQAQYLPGVDNGLKVQLSYPAKVLVGKSAKVSLTFQLDQSPAEGQLVFDRQIEAEGFIVLPRKRLLSSLVDSRRITGPWRLKALLPAESRVEIGMALVGEEATGMIALTPQAAFEFNLRGYRFAGLGFQAMSRLGLILFSLGLAGLGLGLFPARKND